MDLNPLNNPYLLGIIVNLSTDIIKKGGKELSKTEFFNSFWENLKGMFKGKDEEKALEENKSSIEMVGNSLYDFLTKYKDEIKEANKEILEQALNEALKNTNIAQLNKLPEVIFDIYKKLENTNGKTVINQQGAYRPIGQFNGIYIDNSKDDRNN